MLSETIWMTLWGIKQQQKNICKAKKYPDKGNRSYYSEQRAGTFPFYATCRFSRVISLTSADLQVFFMPFRLLFQSLYDIISTLTYCRG